jgi:hypothetical protein
MLKQDMVTRLILSIRRVKEPRLKLEIRRVSRGGVIVLMITLFSWRVRVGELVFPVLWWLAISVAGYFGIRLTY